MQAYNQDEDFLYHILVRPCAEACGVDENAVQKIVPASEEQGHFMERHRANGSYVMQTVLHIQGNPTKPFLWNSAQCRLQERGFTYKTGQIRRPRLPGHSQ